MNNDLISKSRATEILKSLAYDKDMSDEEATVLCMAWGAISRLKPEDAEIVRHGYWVYDPNAQDWGIGGFCCSECHVLNNNLGASDKIHPSWFAGSKYCPQCGAIMDGDVEYLYGK